MVAAIAEAVIRGRNQECSSAGAPFHPARASRWCLKPRDRLVEIPQLHHERRQRLAHFLSGRRPRSAWPVRGRVWALRRDDADFSQVAVQAVQQLRSLRNQHLPHFVTNQRGLSAKTLDVRKGAHRSDEQLADLMAKSPISAAPNREWIKNSKLLDRALVMSIRRSTAVLR
jgi:hypothetical protein